MRVSYNKLWKMLIDRGMKKKSIKSGGWCKQKHFCKLGKNENVTLPVLLDICEYLKVTLAILWKLCRKLRSEE